MMMNRHNTLKSLLLAATMFVSPLITGAATPAVAQIGISVEIAPPELPVYVQPPMPEEGYIWTPGYWAWGEDQSYYWVPGTWVRPPSAGVLWTPPYWGWGNGRYMFHDGYWGAHVGFYGGINYGFGYGGIGFEGGRWEGNGFVYNRAVNNFGSVHIANSYERNVTVINNNRIAFVGGERGLRAEPTAEQRSYEAERHIAATTEQTRHFNAAIRNPEFAASRNHGNPPVAATSRPAEFERGAARPEAARPGTTPRAGEGRPDRAKEAPSAEAHRAEPPAAARHPVEARAPKPPRAARPAETHNAEPRPQAEHRAPRPAEARQPRPAAPHAAAPRQAPAPRPAAAPRQAPRPAAPRAAKPEAKEKKQ